MGQEYCQPSLLTASAHVKVRVRTNKLRRTQKLVCVCMCEHVRVCMCEHVRVCMCVRVCV